MRTLIAITKKIRKGDSGLRLPPAFDTISPNPFLPRVMRAVFSMPNALAHEVKSPHLRPHYSISQ